MGAQPELGRLPQPSDGFACANCAVLSHDFWQIHFRGDKNVLGRRIELDGHPMTVIGVLPRTFEMPGVIYRGLDRAGRRDVAIQ